MHEQLFTFALSADKELVNLRAVVQGEATRVQAPTLERGGSDPAAAAIGKQEMFVADSDRQATIYDRAKLQSGNVIDGPAIVTEMDSTSVILPGHAGSVDDFGNILIRPTE